MRSVVLCGSKKFKPQIVAWVNELREAGVTVLAPFLHSGQEEWASLSDDYKKFIALGLTHDHFYKIRIADVVFIYNEGGYAGPSTTMEIAYAVALGKPIYAFSHDDQELCRDVLFRDIVTSPQNLLKKL